MRLLAFACAFLPGCAGLTIIPSVGTAYHEADGSTSSMVTLTFVPGQSGEVRPTPATFREPVADPHADEWARGWIEGASKDPALDPVPDGEPEAVTVDTPWGPWRITGASLSAAFAALLVWLGIKTRSRGGD